MVLSLGQANLSEPDPSHKIAEPDFAPNFAHIRIFTRHKKALARVAFLRLQASYRFVLEVLLCFADKDGVCWPKPREIAAITPRSACRPNYSVTQVLKALRGLRALGLLTWDNVAPFDRLPATRGNPRGRWSQSGQRVWRLNLAALEGGPTPLAKAKSRDGTAIAGSILQDRSGSILQDRSTDLSRSPSEIFKMDHAATAPRARPAAARGASAPQKVSETPSAMPAASGHAAGETPGAAAAAPPSRSDRPEMAIRTRAKREKEQEKCQVADPAAEAAAVAVAMKALANLPPVLAELLQRGARAAAARDETPPARANPADDRKDAS